MNDERKEISITIIKAGEVNLVKTYLHQYRNLMVLLNNSIYLENFGECGGQGRCATCMVKAVGLKAMPLRWSEMKQLLLVKRG